MKLRKAVVKLCTQLKDHSIKLTDALGANEHLLQSAVAKEDGNLYSNFLDQVYKAQGCFDKPDWADHIFEYAAII